MASTAIDVDSPEKAGTKTASEHAPSLAGSVITADGLGDEKIRK